MAPNNELKSILKKSSAHSAPSTSTAVKVLTKEDRDRETALYHAALIQQQKDVEMEILDATERLIDFPLNATSTAAKPALSDVTLFKELLQLFQPSDYDILIEERNINDHCGYALCPSPRIRDGGRGTYRLLGTSGKAKDFKVVRKEELEKWCSDDCAKRAMYVKVQLSERPAWERAASSQRIELLNEEKSEAEKREAQLAEELRRLNISREEKRNQSSAQLAAERGDRGAVAQHGRVDITIREKEVTGVVKAPSLDDDAMDTTMTGMTMNLEGYTPKYNYPG